VLTCITNIFAKLSLTISTVTFLYRLVLIADKNKVHSQFPIPLINRLEKHYVSTTSLLTADQKAVKDQLENWLAKFVEPFKLSS